MSEPFIAESRRPVIFVVDDETVIASTLAIILDKAGFETHAMFSAEEALASLTKLRPDLLLTDVMMGGMNGIELATIFRSKLPDCKILLFSGQALTTDLLTKAREQGHNFDILSKPVHPADLIAKLRR
jgi:CheY-like chemotaxis protein